MTDETVPETTDETVPEYAPTPEGRMVPQMWAAQSWANNYVAILPLFVGDTVNKVDRQAYRLKAADIALNLTAMEAGFRRG